MRRQEDDKIFLNTVQFSKWMSHMSQIYMNFIPCAFFLNKVVIYFKNEQMCTLCVKNRVSVAASKQKGRSLLVQWKQQGLEVTILYHTLGYASVSFRRQT